LNGGLAVTPGSGDRLQACSPPPFASPVAPVVLEAKQLLIMGVLIYAFFKFAWALRISHFASIMIGATPPYERSEQ
jgi:uncharacterized membrane protein